MFALRTSISKEYIDHVRDFNSPKHVWETLESLFTRKSIARLQLLENELAMLTQEGMSIFEYFLQVKNICAEISELDVEEKISEARIRRFLSRGVKKEYSPFVTSIQGWANQPSVEELENLLSNQEAPAKQMAKNLEPNSVIFYKGKNNKITPAGNKDHEQGRKATDDSSQNHNSIKCYNLEEWIIYSGFSHHVTGNDSLLLELRQHNGEWVIVTADNSTHPIAKEGVVKIGVGDTRTVKLNDVFRVPGLKKRNLVSVSQITNSGKYVLFGPNEVKVLDNVKNIDANVIFTGEKKGFLFIMSVGEAYVKKTSQTDRAAIWHARLGHLSYQLLQEISLKKLVEGISALQNV
ncbi:Retrovirus-related Pol polyprotein from transposon TNT 1-94 [Quillaja saponaria]|uniref:Retrovirus-related Pol polyprotein from transposon TNT 1-94 n=1 Tax=Quillaja saponaria TaxID=32244 RepID=A0AAD7LSB0_QUISA|nr:Retrovirus-related Pol polyprotein from transposon TNT 1-94 [Quillaja saponaria]